MAQQREVTLLSWNHFVPASDDKLREQAAAFSKQRGVNVRVDTIAHLQIPSKITADPFEDRRGSANTVRP
jgi:hypothetical protein